MTKNKDDIKNIRPEIRAILNEANKQFDGKAVLKFASDIEENPFIERIPTGSIGLDCVTGGGIPRGGLTQYIGVEGSGKTTMAFNAIKEAQKKYGKDARIAYAAVEHEIDRVWAERVGVTFDDSLVIIWATSGEYYLRSVKELIDSNTYQLIIIDSLPALTTLAQIDGELGDRHVAVRSSLISEFLSCCIYGAKSDEEGNRNKTSVLAINQYRVKIGGYTPPGMVPRKQFGPEFLKYAKLLDVAFSVTQHISKGSGETKVDYGKRIKYHVEKGKAGCADGGVGIFDLYYKPDSEAGIAPGKIDEGKEYRMVAMREGLIDRAGRYFTYGEEKFGGEELEVKIATDGKFKEKLRLEILAKAGIQCR